MINQLHFDHPGIPLPYLYIPENAICAEIGVLAGHGARKIMKFRPQKLHLIDSWCTKNAWDIENDEWTEILEQRYRSMNNCDYRYGRPATWDGVYNAVVEDFDQLNNVEIHRINSTDITFERNYFDWIYIDADHLYDSVSDELYHYEPFMKRGGVISGDDVGFTCDDGGVKKAVEDFCNDKGFNLFYHSSERQFLKDYFEGETVTKNHPFPTDGNLLYGFDNVTDAIESRLMQFVISIV